mgnify:CR=1 FL=1
MYIYDEETDSYQDIDYDFDEDEKHVIFKDPGSKSALRAATGSNPRNLPCPTCRSENVLTPRDRDLGYQCDACADTAEGSY